ncbi:uncharacterized protein LOC108872968 isoform X2 [Lates calcarifer]|uniref:Uncharacterized protein LOC108872968 isoform X2 n=1 Tax=Lates calcarifer TaxID=8187 RepID=A0AAJ7PBR6_LATCA|nr:uncharacterized protein LOC108872968 isoform X2 [Lates calcarifer]
MSVCWMFMVLLACMASHAAQSQSTCTCSEKFTKQITICSPSTETVYVPCPNMTADIMTFTLLKDEEIISNQTCNKEQDAQNCTLVRFSLNEMTHRSSGIYRCEGRSIFPPPSIKVQSDLRIRIHVGKDTIRIVLESTIKNVITHFSGFGFWWLYFSASTAYLSPSSPLDSGSS